MTMRLTGHPALKFDALLPLYNWIYPVAGRPLQADATALNEISPSRSRAIYVHIPFCETICTFCPFVRAAGHDRDVVDVYVRALIREIELKGRIAAISGPPIGAVFFGGGTPSYLEPEQIIAIGAALRAHFDLSHCREFSFEFEVKSATPQRVAAALEIGVTHARFGAQTFSPAFRKLFNLTSTVEQIAAAATLFRTAFDHVSCDMLLGMHGQTEEQLFDDVQQACSLGLDNIDYYPINNLVTQPRLNRSLREAGHKPTTGLTKFYMVMFVRELLRQSGFLPHNGHGYVRSSADELARAPLITDSYSFVYHEHTLGYPDFDLLGFGVNALSSFKRFSMSNDESREVYVRKLLAGELPFTLAEHEPELDACRPIALTLPYHGNIMKSWVDWEAVPHGVQRKLEDVVAHGLVSETADAYYLTSDGLNWYTNLMFYLLPDAEQATLGRLMQGPISDPRRDIESSGLDA